MADVVLGNLVWKITGDKSGFDTSISEADKKIKEFGKSATKTGKDLTKFVSLPILGVGTAAVYTAAKIETQRIAFGKLLQDTEKGTELFEELKRFSAETPLQLEDITAGAQRLLAFGVSADEVQDKLRRLGDAALGNSNTLDRLTNAYGKLKAKGRATLEELNLFTEAGVPILDQLAKQYGVSTAEVLKFVNEGKVGFEEVDGALISLTSKGGQFNGVMEAISQTTEGKLSTAIDNVKLAAAEFGAILLPVVKDILDNIIDVAKWFSNLDEGTKKLIVTVAGFAAVIGPAVFAVGKLTTAVKAFNLTALTGPTGIIVLVGLAVGAIVGLISKIKSSQEEARKAAEAYKNSFTGIREAIFSQLGEVDKLNSIITKYSGNLVKLSSLEKEDREELQKSLSILKLDNLIRDGQISRLQALAVLQARRKKLIQENRDLEEGLNKTDKKGNEEKAKTVIINEKIIKTLSDYQKKLLEINVQEAENQKDFESAADYRLVLINNEEQEAIKANQNKIKELDELKKQQGKLNAEQVEERKSATKDLEAIEIVYNERRRLLAEETATKEKELTLSIINTTVDLATKSIGAFSNLAKIITDKRLEGIESQRLAALEAAGVAEETEVERLQKEYDAAVAAGDATLIEEKRIALERAKINEDFEKKKAETAYKGALAEWGLTLAGAIATGALAVINAFATKPFLPLGIAMGAVATILSGVQIASVAASKPKKPSLDVGTFDVLEDGPADIHKGEMYIPKPFAQSVREGEAIIAGKDAGNIKKSQTVIQFITETKEKLYEKILDDSKNGVFKLSGVAIVRT